MKVFYLESLELYGTCQCMVTGYFDSVRVICAMYVKYVEKGTYVARCFKYGYTLYFINVQVNDNGVISFNSLYNFRTPLSLPLSGSYRIIAPYWADVDTRGAGDIFYRQTTNASLLVRATNEIRATFPASQGVTIRSLLIATWSKVGYYNHNDDKVCIYVH